MKVRVSYVEEVDDDFRRAINAFYGKTGLATREEVKDWFYRYGQSMNDDLSGLAEGEEEIRLATTTADLRPISRAPRWQALTPAAIRLGRDAFPMEGDEKS